MPSWSEVTRQGSRAEEAFDFLVGVMAFQEHNGLPASGLEAGIDTLGFRGDLVEKLAVTKNVGAARSAQFDKGEAALVRGVKFEEAFNAAEALDDALRVVNAVHPDAEKRSLDA
jgi:hypothetical protein